MYTQPLLSILPPSVCGARGVCTGRRPHPLGEAVTMGRPQEGNAAWRASRAQSAGLVRCKRCKVVKKDGSPCKAPAIRGAAVCVAHGGRLVLWRRRMKKAKVVRHERFSFSSPKESSREQR